MRIVAGKYGGRRLKTLAGNQTRPTSDKVKGALFNILGERVVDAMALDLFAGCGALGIEAVSRGAQFAVLNDINPSAVRIIEENTDMLGAEEETGIMCQDAFKTIDILARNNMSFDLIFIDPPYESGLYSDIIFQIHNSGILALNGMIVCEHRKGFVFEVPFDYRIYDRRTYGQTSLSFIIEEVVS